MHLVYACVFMLVIVSECDQQWSELLLRVLHICVSSLTALLSLHVAADGVCVWIGKRMMRMGARNMYNKIPNRTADLQEAQGATRERLHDGVNMILSKHRYAPVCRLWGPAGCAITQLTHTSMCQARCGLTGCGDLSNLYRSIGLSTSCAVNLLNIRRH